MKYSTRTRKSLFLSAKEPAARKTGRRIINICSRVARIAIPGVAAYARTKPDASEKKNGAGLERPMPFVID
jgi:short-subunit dehydrogenase